MTDTGVRDRVTRREREREREGDVGRRTAWWKREGTKTRRRKWGIGQDEEEGWRVTGSQRDETGHEDRRDQEQWCEGDGYFEGDNVSGVGELKREGVRVGGE